MSSRPKRPRIWQRRLAAIALGLMPFILCEGLLRLCLPAPGKLDPFVGFPGSPPLFIEGEDAFEIAPSRSRFFAPTSFTKHKLEVTTRVFCLGGSTVQGRPYSHTTAFPHWLELSLAEAQPERDWEVINCGGISYASYRLLPILKELLEYEPDLIIVYAGQNEFLEARSYQQLREYPAALTAILQSIAGTYTFAALHALVYTEAKVPGTDLETEVDAILDHERGLGLYQRDNHWRRGVLRDYERALQGMIFAAKSRGVPLIFVDPVSNLRDQAPFKSQQRAGMSQADLAQWTSVRRDARALANNDPEAAHKLYRRALDTDDQHAGLHFEFARFLLRHGDPESARLEFAAALELDVCPLRMPESLHEVLRAIAQANTIPLCEVRSAIRRDSRHGIPGTDWLLDHVHPSIKGHQVIALELHKTLVATGFVSGAAESQRQIQEIFAAYQSSLKEIYFQKGARELERLRLWSQGRAGLGEASGR